LISIIVVNELGGQSSTGIEAKKLYQFLNKHTGEFLFITSRTDLNSDKVILIESLLSRTPNILKKLSIVGFGVDLDSFFSFRLLKRRLEPIKIKRVWGLASASNFYVLSIVQTIKSRINNRDIEFGLHFFDPIPAKLHWGENKLLRNAKKKITKRLLDGIYLKTTASLNMSQYMGKIYSDSFSCAYSSINKWSFRKRTSFKEKKIAFYLGSIYGKRNATELLNFFKSQNKWELHIYGEKNMEASIPNVIFHEFVMDLTQLESPDLLIDLDIDELDVYIPGKSYTYLGCEIPILAISPVNSAVRMFYEVFESTDSNIAISKVGVMACVNNESQIKRAFSHFDDLPKLDILKNRDLLIDKIMRHHIGTNFG